MAEKGVEEQVLAMERLLWIGEVAWEGLGMGCVLG